MAIEVGHHDPIMDGNLSDAIRRRGSEMLGILLLVLSATAIIGVGTYSPSDSGLLTSTGNQAQNLLGSFGAEVVSAFMVTLGLATWCIPIFFGIWGLRCLCHLKPQWLMLRIFVFPLFALTTAIVAAALPAPSHWPHQFGAGGMLGDSMFAALTYSWPADFENSALSITMLSVVALLVTAGLSLGSTLRGFFSGTFGFLNFISKGLLRIFGFRRKKEAEERTATDSPSRSSFLVFWRKNTKDPVDQAERWDEEIEFTDRHQVDAGESTCQYGGEPVGIFSRIKQSLITAGSWRPKLANLATDRAQVVRPSFEPALTRSGMMEFGPIPTDQEEDQEEQPPVVDQKTKKIRRRSSRAIQEEQPPLIEDEDAELNQAPPLSLLQRPGEQMQPALSSEALEQNVRLLESVLKDYGIKGEIERVRPGPVVTLYELKPEPGLKASRVMGLSDDIARNMSALSARISTIPGRNVIGIELPNEHRETVYLQELLADRDFGDSRMKLAIALGKDIGGEPKFVDLAQMPHILIAGTTGSGKSVAINTLILSLLYRLPPEQCRLIMIDPKMLELSVYDGIPHLLTPVVTDPKKAVVALKWVVSEMEERYRLMSKIGVRKLTSYNERAREAQLQGKKLTRRFPDGFDENGDQIIREEECEPVTLPYIVVIVDELADLMVVAGKEIEACIQRLAQMARASGIHVVMATQRPSVDVITGTIKANFPTRVSFQVTSKIDSRTILGQQGAEQLLGRGDMLYMSGGTQVTRVHGPFVTDEEVEDVVNYLKQFGEPEYLADVLDDSNAGELDATLGLSNNSSSADDEYNIAVQIVRQDRKCSTSYIQRRMEIGYNKAARFVERMESEGLISAANHVGRREILIPE